MTPKERRHPQVLNASRKRRIAKGSGTSVEEINRLLRQYGQMRKLMKRLGKADARTLKRQLGFR
jgi:signal recognition particle subunit SRP54